MAFIKLGTNTMRKAFNAAAEEIEQTLDELGLSMKTPQETLDTEHSLASKAEEGRETSEQEEYTIGGKRVYGKHTEGVLKGSDNKGREI